VSTNHQIGNDTQHSWRAAPGRLSAIIELVLLLCLPALFVVTVFQNRSSRLLAPGDPAPSLTIGNLDSSAIHHFDFKDVPVALLFFSADCPHCLRELTNFDRLSRQFGDQIHFLAVSTSGGFKTKELLRTNQLVVRTMLDRDEQGRKGFGVDIVPALFLVGADGVVVYGESGEKSFGAREQLLMKFVIAIASTREY
jgi:peroxiredoxin